MVERILGKAEVDSSILSGGTISLIRQGDNHRPHPFALVLAPKRGVNTSVLAAKIRHSRFATVPANQLAMLDFTISGPFFGRSGLRI